MCVQQIQVFHCGCRINLNQICAYQIAHTHAQVDNAPCPKLQAMEIPGMRRCRDDGRCGRRQDEFYTFEAEGEGLFEWIERNDKEWSKKKREERKEKERVDQLRLEMGGVMYSVEEEEKTKRTPDRGSDGLNTKVVKKAKRSGGGSEFGSSPGFAGGQSSKEKPRTHIKK